MLLLTIVCLLIATAHGSDTPTSGLLTPAFASNTDPPALVPHAITSNATIFASLAAPIYRNVTPGDAWVFPSSANDLGARGFSCECFSPNDQCCMPLSPSLAPFCISNGSSCCGNVFCDPGESCCGDVCCPANTVCNLKVAGAGCCPIGAYCDGPAICYDRASSNCSDQAVPPHVCCPADSPYCRDFQPKGLACYAYSTTASSTSSVPTMTAAGTSNIFAASASTSTSTSATFTVTISVVSNGDGGVSLEFPTGNASAGLEGASTTYVLEWPATSATATAAVAVAVTSSSKSVESTSTATTTTTSTSSTSASSSTISPLCYDPSANSHSPCPTTTTPSASSSTSDGGFNPPGATIVKSGPGKSQATKLCIPFLDTLCNLFTSLHDWFQTDRGKAFLTYISLAWLAYLTYITLRPPQKQYTARRGREQVQPRVGEDGHVAPLLEILKNIETTENEVGKQDITVVKGSARPLLAPRVVQKREIKVVEGSARPFVKGKRTHSLWEGMRKMGAGTTQLDTEEEEEVAENGEMGGVMEGLGHVFVGAEGKGRA